MAATILSAVTTALNALGIADDIVDPYPVKITVFRDAASHNATVVIEHVGEISSHVVDDGEHDEATQVDTGVSNAGDN